MTRDREFGTLTLEDVRTSRRACILRTEVAVLLGCDPRTVTAALSINGGDIPARRVGRRIVIPREPFLAWFDGESAQPAAPASEAPVEVDAAALIRAKLLRVLAELEGAV